MSTPNGAGASLLQSLKWRSIGPHRGGRVVAVAGDVSNRETFYMGACAGGVWKTTDGGVIWRNVSDGFFKTAAVGAIAVSESDPNVIYAGMGETAIRGNVSHGDGVYKSTDGGKSWQHMGLTETRHIGDIAIHPTNPDLVYVAALGHVWGPNEERGVYRSKDGGQSWEKILYKSERAGSHELAMDPNNPRIIYAAIWDAQRYPHALRSGGDDSGIWKTTDGGDTWTEITRNTGLPKGVLGKIGLAVSGARDNRVWALMEAHDGALFRSDDGGESWQRLSEEPYLRTRAWYYMHIYADPKDADTVWVLNYGIHKSIDGGKTFEAVPSRHGDEHDLWIDPNDTQRMIKGDDGGACVTYNGGRSWSTIFNQPTAQLYHVTTDDNLPYRVYGSQQDNSAISVPSATVEGAIHERDWFEPGGGESGYIALKPGDANIMVAGAIGSGNFNGRLIHYNRTTGQHRNITVWPELAGMGSGAEALKYRFQWTFPIFWSQHEQDALYVAGNRIFKSLDEGKSWEVVSEDLTRNDPETLKPSGGPITKDNTGAEAYGTIFALEESPHQRGLLWAGTDDGLVKISEDGGKNWQNITPAELPEWALISIIDLSKHDAGSAYMAATRYKSHDQKPYLFKTKDFGTNWTLIANGIPEDDFTRTIREDPEQPGLLFCGTETGLYVSYDDGENWQRMGGNFPVVPVHDLVIKGNNLVIATHGRSFWILDDLTPLRQMAAGTLATDNALVLFPAAPKVRMKVYPGFGSDPAKGYVHYRGVGTSNIAMEVIEKPDGTSETHLLDAGENPPDGLVLQYYLREKPKEPITLTIRDADGNEVRTFSSKAEKTPPAGAEAEGAEGAESGSAADEEPKGDTFVPANAGVNRFDWDMRHAPAETAEGMDLKPWEKPLGPVVLPGTYTVEIKAGDATASQQVEVVKDPRVDVSDADLKAQFDMLLQIRDRLADTTKAIGRVRAMRSQLESWEKRTKDSDRGEQIAAAGKAARDELTAIETELIDTTTKSPLMSPSRLFEKLNALTEFVDSADVAPAKQSVEVFEKLSGELDDQLARIDAAVENQIGAFNKLIQEAELQPVG
ncbi:MAG TPA: glycosyl hydrolase [Thermomicrobiales bacterium]|nr:glycosyl hydrolase [Thermomicrobiales bacterium]